MAAYGLALAAIDAVSGRTFQASPDPSVLLSLLATAWAAYRLAESGRARLAVPAALVLWAVYMAGFVAMTRLLVGWNGSLPWQPRSATWMIAFVASVPLVAAAGQIAGRRASTARPARGERE